MGLRLGAALAAILLVSSAAQAGVANDLTAAINKCAAIADEAARHACYDQLPTLAKELGPAAASEAQPPAPSSPGGFDLFGGNPVPVDHFTATVESITSEFGVFIVTLDNGQVWKQVTAGELLHFSKEKKDRVTIWKGAFGYLMQIEGFHTRYHVRRIQ